MSSGQSNSPRYSWTQPICGDCWDRRNPGRKAHRLIEPDVERCAFCGGLTRSGLYVRADPTTVVHPAIRDH
jgi:hypothetical protein